MKRLLLVPFVLLMPAAHAVDYAQCEAMRKVAIRLQYQKAEAVKDAKKTACMDLTAVDVPIGKYVACMNGQPTDLQPNPTKGPSVIEADYDRKLARVIGDMKKGGCVMD